MNTLKSLGLEGKQILPMMVLEVRLKPGKINKPAGEGAAGFMAATWLREPVNGVPFNPLDFRIEGEVTSKVLQITHDGWQPPNIKE